MASSETDECQEESFAETSFDSASIPGPPTRHENPEFIESCPAALEGLKDKYLYEDDTGRNPFEIFSSRPPPTPNFVPALLGSCSIHHVPLISEQNQKKNSCLVYCTTIFNCYSKYAIAFRNSKLFYIVQFVLLLLPLSAIAMGIKYSQYCGSSFPALTLIIGMFGVLFVGVWTSINVFHHFRKRCTGQQKFLVRMLSGILAILLSIEMYLYFHDAPSYDPGDKHYCSKIFIDYTFYKYFSIGGSLIFTTIIYLPDFRSFICSFECSMPAPVPLYDQL